MNQRLKNHRLKNRQTAAQKLTDAINSVATLQNALDYTNTDEKSAFVQELLQEQDVRASYTTDEGTRNCLRLENKLEKHLKQLQEVAEANAKFIAGQNFVS